MRRPTSIHDGVSTTTTNAASGWGTLDYHYDDRLVVEDADPLLEEEFDSAEHGPEKPFHKFRIQIKKPNTSSTTQVEDRTRRWSGNSAPSLPSHTTTTTSAAMSSSIQESRRRRQGYLLNSERRLSDQRDLRRSSILSSLDKLVVAEDDDNDEKLWSSVRSSSSSTTTRNDTNTRRSSSSSTSHITNVANDHNPTQATKNSKTPRRHAVLVPVGSLSELWTATPLTSSSQHDDACLKTSTGGATPPQAHGSTTSTKRQERERRQENVTQSNNNTTSSACTNYRNHDNEEHNPLEQQRQQSTNRAQRRGSITKYSLMDGELPKAFVPSTSTSSTPFDLDNVKSRVVSTNYGSTTSLATSIPKKVSRGRKQDTATKTEKVGVLAAAADLLVENEEQDVPTVRSSSRTSRRRGSVTRYSLDDSTAPIAATAATCMVEEDANHEATRNMYDNVNANNKVSSSSNHSRTTSRSLVPASDDDEELKKNRTSQAESPKKTRAARRGVITKYSLEQPAY